MKAFLAAAALLPLFYAAATAPLAPEVRPVISDTLDHPSCDRLTQYLQAQLDGMAAAGVIDGTPKKAGNLESDELQWIAGDAAASGPFRISLALHLHSSGSSTDLGLQSEPVGSPADPAKPPTNWSPLIMNVAAIEVYYFDPRLDSWIDHWKDRTARPTLVRIRLWKTAKDAPFKAELHVPPLKAPGK